VGNRKGGEEALGIYAAKKLKGKEEIIFQGRQYYIVIALCRSRLLLVESFVSTT